MKNNFEQMLSEELLKTAIIEDAMIDHSECPTDMEIKKIHTLSKEFDKSMIKKAKIVFRKKQIRSCTRYIRKSAAIVLLLFGLVFASLFTVKASREYLIKSLMKIKNHFLQIQYQEDGEKDNNYQMLKPTYIPMGYKQTSSYSESYTQDFYENDKNETLTITYLMIERGTTTGFNTKEYKVKKVKIGEYKGLLFITNDRETGNMLEWDDGKTQYSISTSSTDTKEILKIARSFR